MTREKSRYFIGLDLGKLNDYTALTVVREVQREVQASENAKPHWEFEECQLQHLRRFPIGTPYMQIAEDVKALQETEQLRDTTNYVIADRTGVGEPVFEMLQKAVIPRAGKEGHTVFRSVILSPPCWFSSRTASCRSPRDCRRRIRCGRSSRTSR